MRGGFILLLIAGCGGDKSGTDTGALEGDADTDADSDTDTGDEAACEALTPGGWTADGSCFGMTMTATLALEPDGCTFTLSGWNMAMSVPEGGTVTGADVTLTGSGWTDCTGTTDGASISGTCGDGCGFDMASDG